MAQAVVPVETTIVNADHAEAVELARTDLNFLAMLVSPEDFKYEFPPYYQMLFLMVLQCPEKLAKYAIGLPRGFAKTTWVKLVALAIILFTDKKFILVVGASEGLASNLMLDVIDMLDAPNVRALFGNWRAGGVFEDTKTSKVFRFRGRVVIIKAAGANTSIRGISRKLSRPDIMIMDDIQRKEDIDNDEVCKGLLTWMLGTLMMARDPGGCIYLFIGNMYPKNSILAKLRDNPGWTSFIVGGLLADGTSLWEELRPAQELLAEYQSLIELGEADVFISEVLNSTEFAAASGLDFTKLQRTPTWMLDTPPDGSFILIDPSGSTSRSDDCVIGHFSSYDGIAAFDEMETDTFTPLETIKTALDMGLRNNTRLICVENVAYQASLLFWFNHICYVEGISGFTFLPVSPKGVKKNTRIKDGLKRCIKGEIVLGDAVYSLVFQQAQKWNPLKTNNEDDIIDIIGYVEEVQQSYGPHIIKTIFDEDFSATTAAHTDSLALPY